MNKCDVMRLLIPAMDVIDLWVVYESLPDYPGLFASRRFIIGATEDAEPTPTATLITAATLGQIQQAMQTAGRIRLGRELSDDRCVVESWL